MRLRNGSVKAASSHNGTHFWNAIDNYFQHALNAQHIGSSELAECLARIRIVEGLYPSNTSPPTNDAIASYGEFRLLDLAGFVTTTREVISSIFYLDHKSPL